MSKGWQGTEHRPGRASVDGGQFCRRCGGWRGSLGFEPTVELYVEHLVDILRDVRRVLRADGTLWLNLGDCYASAWPCSRRNSGGQGSLPHGKPDARPPRLGGALKPKDLVGVPWRVALALQADGWIVRSDIVWEKPNALPESVHDRPTRSHEYLFLLAISRRYYYDADAIREPHTTESVARARRNWRGERQRAYPGEPQTLRTGVEQQVCHPRGRNKRTVWTIPTAAFKGAHFATFPPALVQPCILAGTSGAGCCPRCGAPWERIVEPGQPLQAWQQACGGDAKGHYNGTRRKAYTAAGAQDASAVKARILAGMRERKTVGWRPTCTCAARVPVPCVVLDPFAGVATAGVVAVTLGRRFLGIELNPQYLQLARERLDGLTADETSLNSDLSGH